MASRGQPGALSAFASLLGGVEHGLTAKRAREMEDEQRRQDEENQGIRRVMQNLQIRSALTDMGAEQIASPAVARLRSSIPLQKTGHASENPLLPKDTETFQLPDTANRGAILNYRINPDKTREARQNRRAEARDARTERRMSALESLRASLRARPLRNIDPLSTAGIQAAVDRAKKIRAVTPRKPSVGEQMRSQRDQEELDAAEAWWNSEGVQSGQAGRVGQTYQKIRAAHPDWKPQRIMRAVKQAVEANAKGANLKARTDKTSGGADNFHIDENGNFVMGPGPSGTAAAPAAPSRAPAPTAKALPPTVDQAKYESDPQYRAWVDGKLGAGP